MQRGNPARRESVDFSWMQSENYFLNLFTSSPIFPGIKKHFRQSSDGQLLRSPVGSREKDKMSFS